jgi:hypothetical protein
MSAADVSGAGISPMLDKRLRQPCTYLDERPDNTIADAALSVRQAVRAH